MNTNIYIVDYFYDTRVPEVHNEFRKYGALVAHRPHSEMWNLILSEEDISYLKLKFNNMSMTKIL